MGVLMVEQNAPAAMAIASRVLVLKRGKQVAAGSPNEIDSDVFSLREEPIES
jgi:ABC-type branched-subunit amino acid transport system ATPase component